ncbi:carbohydrate porin [Aliagarivorans taiwanensis]|uniref:carbohydrate porin n=1 Tax=Aliagarivorans taiwanensis TaxID=561966 RepID=UPI0004066E12|nr:carbohydrate porin [Aliagarivorans taiwanensis]
MKLKALALAVAAATVSTSAMSVEFNGYFRAGFGNTVGGGSQLCYGHGGPDSHVVGRLADECDTYAEISLSQNVVERSNGERFSIHTLVAYGTHEAPGNYVDGRGNSWQGISGEGGGSLENGPWGGARLAFREAYAKYRMAGGSELWAGNRYYGRKDIHINDWYYVNGSGYGIGLDNITIGNGALAFAVRNAKWNDEFGGADALEAFTATPIFDLRWNGVNVGMGSLDLIANIGFVYASDAQEASEVDYNDKTGVALTAEWTVGLSGGFNKLVAQYSTEGFAWAGYGMNNHLGDGYNAEAAQIGRKSWRIMDHGLYKFNRNVDMSWNVWYSQLHEDEGDTGKRYGFTVRPRYLWNNTMSTSLEVGYYSNEDGWAPERSDLTKIAVSQNWSPLQEKGGFWARPEIRVFLAHYMGDDETQRYWSDDNPEWGSWGTGTIKDRDTMIGAQVEAWW